MRRPLTTLNNNDLLYAGLGPRLGAWLLDVLCLLPLLIVVNILDTISIKMNIWTELTNIPFTICYNVLIVKRFGGTPGMLIKGIEIVKLNLEPLSWIETILRYSVKILLNIAFCLVIIYALLKADEAHYLNLVWTERTNYIEAFYPVFFKIYNWIIAIWLVSEFIVVLTNKKKRSPNDYIAGTVVVHRLYLNNLKSEKI